MPIYEFECLKCKKIFSDLLPINTDTTNCPICQNLSKKIVSVFSTNFFSKEIINKYTKTNSNLTVRIPEYSDNKTGNKIGLGKPEVRKIKRKY